MWSSSGEQKQEKPSEPHCNKETASSVPSVPTSLCPRCHPSAHYALSYIPFTSTWSNGYSDKFLDRSDTIHSPTSNDLPQQFELNPSTTMAHNNLASACISDPFYSSTRPSLSFSHMAFSALQRIQVYNCFMAFPCAVTPACNILPPPKFPLLPQAATHLLSLTTG